MPSNEQLTDATPPQHTRRLGTELHHQGPLELDMTPGPCFSGVACLTLGSLTVPVTEAMSLWGRAVDSGSSSLSIGGHTPAHPWGSQEQAGLELRAQRRKPDGVAGLELRKGPQGPVRL